ncbi:hypothetical protein L3Y34_009833 [Caenorhabditis briggsae]|uniref:Uncharacterized protein n=1 Tax=Caenorhabditis briggsae TaxID=6238 RepID=A0AAE9AD39_CAEBR|nr:hypothetical protein L3Y34_009833 [Caenorhabditis briggsae]
MTGVASREETLWILERAKELVPGLDSYHGIWIDGERKTPGYDNFTWTDGYTEGYGALGEDNAGLSGINQ